MIIIETSVFTHVIGRLMSDDNYAKLQEALIKKPDLGDLIPGSSGLRKVRWKIEGKGKRAGVRIIYYWKTTDDQLWMLYAYKKSDLDNLTKEQLKLLSKITERWH